MGLDALVERLGPTHREQWCGFFALPREVKLEEDGRLAFYPVEELKQLRGEKTQQTELLIKEEKRELPVRDSSCFEMLMTVDLEQSNATSFSVIVKETGSKKAVLTFDFKGQMMYVDRTRADGWDKGVSQSPLLLQDEKEFCLHIFVDRCSVEVYTDNYKTVHSKDMYRSERREIAHERTPCLGFKAEKVC